MGIQDSSVGFAIEPLAAAPGANGALTSSAGGALAAATYYVKSFWYTAQGTSLPAAETSLAVLVNNVLNVAAPASPPAGVIGWGLGVSIATGTETIQNTGPIALGTPWVEPTTGLIAGAAMPSVNSASTAGTFAAPVRWLEYTSSTFGVAKTDKQAQGLRTSTRFPRIGRRAYVSLKATGDLEFEALSKGQGLALQWGFGTAVSTLVSGTTYQQLVTLGNALPSASVQIGVPQESGQVDVYNYTGMVCSQVDITCPNLDIAKFKFATDGVNVAINSTALTPPVFLAAGTGTLYHFANASIVTGATAPTTTTLASGGSVLAGVRDLSVTIAHGVKGDRFNFNGGGRQNLPLPGAGGVTGKMTVEYQGATLPNAVLADTPIGILMTYLGGPIDAATTETLQIYMPLVYLDTELPKPNKVDLVTMSVSFTVLDNLAGLGPIALVLRTNDTAL